MPDNPNSPDNNYHGGPIDMSQLQLTEEDEIPISELTTEPGDEKAYTYFRHKLVMRYEIPRAKAEDGTTRPPFAFKNHVCRVENSDIEEFLDHVSGLHGSDKINITQLRTVSNEIPLAARLAARTNAIRGAASTSNIISPTQNKPAESPMPESQASKPPTGTMSDRGLQPGRVSPGQRILG